METYTKLDGQVINLTDLTPEQRAYFDRCVTAYRVGTSWGEFGQLVVGRDNPLVRDADGWVTKAVYYHPLFQAVHDLEQRLGIAQGDVGAEPHYDLARDPLMDTQLKPSEATVRKTVTG